MFSNIVQMKVKRISKVKIFILDSFKGQSVVKQNNIIRLFQIEDKFIKKWIHLKLCVSKSNDKIIIVKLFWAEILLF